MDNPDSTLTFSQYTKPISANAKYFFYELALDDRRKLNGVVWQTSTMRANFEIFGSFISLGTTKRAINKWIWLYMSARLYSEHRKMCLACEGIVCGERHDVYKFLCQFLINNSPGQLPTEVILVAGGGFFNQEMVKCFGFFIAKYLMDWFHLFNTGLTDTFGEHGCNLTHR